MAEALTVPGAARDRTVVFVTFETEFCRLGGLAAVMTWLPKELHQSDSKEQCIVIAPHFQALTRPNELKRQHRIRDYASVLSFAFAVRGVPHRVDVVELVGTEGVNLYLLSSAAFFTAPKNPYVNPCDASKPLNPYRNPSNPEKLTEDALFFCAAVPTALVELHKAGKITSKTVVLHLQDWETACVAQAIELVAYRPELSSCVCTLTLHNPYDRYVGTTSSLAVLDLAEHLQLSEGHILPQMMPLMRGAISTVSEHFAKELRSDPLHTQAFAPHLQDMLATKTLVGIDNGLFMANEFPFSCQALDEAHKGNFVPLRDEKMARRRELGSVMETYQKQLAEEAREGEEAWGEALDLSDPHVPVFLLMGRDDPCQKGFDVMAEAIRATTKEARYVFTPIPGDEDLLGLAFLKRLAEDCPGRVQVFPFRMQQDAYETLQKGSSFMVMGSLYEPFGAATEAYVTGMPVVARATGGLVQQVTPHPEGCKRGYLTPAALQVIHAYHAEDDAPTGFLFRERFVDPSSAERGWLQIVQCAYWQANPKADRVEERKQYELFNDIVAAAAAALEHAIELYQEQPLDYAKMIYSGYEMLARFSWDRAIASYKRHLYDAAET